MLEPMIEVHMLNVTLGGHHILKDVSLPIYKNKVTAVIGQSGCGKTTLLKALNRSVEGEGAVLSGDIRLGGNSIYKEASQEIRRKIGLIGQKPSPFPFSVYKNMSYALSYYGGLDKTAMRAVIVNNMKRVGLYDEVADQLDRDARDLSGGQQQRLCIARSLAVNPLVLLLDEPCSSLDIKNIMKVEATIQEIKKNYTVVIVTHSLSQARRLSDYTLFMENGESVEFGETKELFDHAKDERTREYMSYVL